VEVCLHTPQQSSAVRQAQVLASELEDHWYILRRREIKHRLSSVFGDCLAPYTRPLIFGFSNKVSGTGGRMFNA
jgi:hypothetical protein